MKEKLGKIFIRLLKIGLCFTGMLFVGVYSVYALFWPGESIEVWDWQLWLYFWYSIFLIVILYIIPFFKTMKLTVFVMFFLILLHFNAAKILPSVSGQYDIIACKEDAICKEGLIADTKYGKILINKENCLKHKWDWDDKEKKCRLYCK